MEMLNANVLPAHSPEDICRYLSLSDNLIGEKFGTFRKITEEV
jgi:hypothetical protein